MKTITGTTAVVLSLLSFLIPATICISSTTSESLSDTEKAEEGSSASLTPEEFVQNYAEIALIKYTFLDDSTGCAEAIAKYLEKTGVNPGKMEAFVSGHTDDILFWKNIWEEIESELEQRLEIPDKVD